MERHFHTIEIMLWGAVGALIVFNVIKMAAVHGIDRQDLLGDLSRASLALVK